MFRELREMARTHIPKTLREALEQGNVVPFAGAGVSRAVRLKPARGTTAAPAFPSWKELLQKAAVRLRDDGKTKEAACVEAFLDISPPELLQAAAMARRMLGTARWTDFLVQQFRIQPAAVNPESLALARLLWQLGATLLVTTNYDNVLAWAAPPEMQPIRWVIEAKFDFVKQARGQHHLPTVWHLHGHIDQPERLILTPADYSGLYSGADSGATYKAALPALHHLLVSRTLLFVGFGLADEHVNEQLAWLADAFQGQASHFALVPRTHGPLPDGIEPVEFDGEADLLELLKDMAAIAGHEASPAPSAREFAGPLREWPAAPPALLESCLATVADGSIREALRRHLEEVAALGSETPDNEDDYIALRRKFFKGVESREGHFLDSVDGLGRLSVDASTLPLVYEVGRILTENRRGNAAYRLLNPVQAFVESTTLGAAVRSRLLDALGEAARFAGRTEHALELYNLVLGSDPHDHFALKHIGTIHRLRGDLREAEKAFLAALAVHPSHHVYFSLGYLYQEMGDTEEAIKHYELCVNELKSRDGDMRYYRVHLQLAFLRLLRGQESQALQSALKTLEDIRALCAAGASDPFMEFCRFAARVVRLFIERNEERRKRTFEECSRWIGESLDEIEPAVFYCHFWDIRRTRDACAEKIRALRDGPRLDALLDELEERHRRLQAREARKRLRSLAERCERLVFVSRKASERFAKLVSGGDECRSTFEAIVGAFDDVNRIAAQPLTIRLEKEIVHPVNGPLRSLQRVIDDLLDHSALACCLDSEGLGALLNGRLKAFTAAASPGVIGLFEGFLKAPEDGGFRVFGKKLLMFDATGRARVFVNPTVGCSVGCSFCYLPAYGIEHTVKPASGEVEPSLYRQALAGDKRFRAGPGGTLISVGSFCEPFLKHLSERTVEIIRAIAELGNPMQVATRVEPPKGVAAGLAAAVDGRRGMLTVNCSVNEPKNLVKLKKWAEATKGTDVQVVGYIKPFLEATAAGLDQFIDTGRRWANLNFVVGSLYVAPEIEENLSLRDEARKAFSFQTELRSPIVETSRTPGVQHSREETFRRDLQQAVSRSVFRTVTCAGTAERRVPDPVGVFGSGLCIMQECSNYRVCAASSPSPTYLERPV
jgi:tetratricopeptide (TPR) repeat protein